MSDCDGATSIAPVSTPSPRPHRVAGPIHEVDGDQVSVDLPGVARVVLRGGVVEQAVRDPRADEADVTWFLQGHVRQLAELQRGVFALRASAVVVDGLAVAVCSTGATGCSAVAAGLARRGHGVIADGWLPVRLPGLTVDPVTDELALWPDVARLAGRDPEGGSAVRPGLLKRHHRFPGGGGARLAAVIVLRRSGSAEVGPAVEGGGSALQLVLGSTALPSLLPLLGRAEEHFRWAVAIATGCRVQRLEVDGHQTGLEEPALEVEAVVRA